MTWRVSAPTSPTSPPWILPLVEKIALEVTAVIAEGAPPPPPHQRGGLSLLGLLRGAL